MSLIDRLRQMRRNARLARLAGDRSGVAAVEFALIFPVMVILYFGIVELVQAITVNRLVAQTASTVTNIVAQYTTISQSSQLPDILNASAQVMAPYPSNNVKVVVTCIAIDANGHATVAWSQTLNGVAKTTGAAVSVPAGLATPNTDIVLGEVTYAYTPIIDYLHFGTFNLASSIYMLPRNASVINLAP